jgi:hypothetical protein
MVSKVHVDLQVSKDENERHTKYIFYMYFLKLQEAF